MSGPLVSASAAFVAKNSRIPPFAIEQSLRFDGSSYLSLGTGTTHTTTNYTISFWFKMNKPNSGAGGVTIFNTMGNNNTETCIKSAYDWNAIGIDKLGSYWHQPNSGNNYGGGNTLAVYRDPSAWYHVVVAIDTTQSAAADRCKYFVNGVLQELDSGSLGSPIPQNYSPVFRNFEHRIGQDAEWYLAEYHLTTDGTKAATDFGEYDDNGVWRPIEYTGNYGTFGFYLKFDSSATNGIGHDHSGNGLHWTANSFTTSGTGTDVMSDTPTTNWATLNSLSTSANGTFSDGNLSFAGASGWGGSKSSIAIPATGKWYAEFTLVSTSSNSAQADIGIFPEGNSNGYNWTGSYGLEANNGFFLITNGSYSSNRGGTTAGGSIFQIAVDADNGKVWFGVDNSWYDTYNTTNGDPSAGTNPSGSSIDFSATTFFMGVKSDLNTWVANFGQRAFAYTPPTGFKALNTRTLPAPDIADGSDYFNTVLYTGTQGTLSVTGVGFQPDFVWIKNRGSAVKHMLFDSIRNVRRSLSSSNTDQEAYESSAGYLSAFDTDGFTVVEGTSAGVNWNNDTFVSWNWFANGNGSNIAAGSIDGTNPTIASTVSANPSAGFSIVTWTAPSSSQTNSVGHGLGVAPSFVICKSRSGGAGGLNWSSYHVSLGKDKYINLESAGTAQTVSNYWGANGMTSTTIGLPTGSSSTGYNNNTGNMVAYCFAEVEGYSKFGIYERNGSSDGPYIHLGFTPALILIKEYAAGTEGWALYDNKRLGYNPNDYPLFPNTTQTESYIASTYPNEIDFLSNGFKIRTSDSRYNSSLSSYRYLYAAWAVNPFGGDGVSPATAR